jgi:hypothetical protein
MSKEIDITGFRFGRLTVIKKIGHHIRKNGRKDALWQCVCDCGNFVNVKKGNLKKGNTVSCGCFQKENRKKPHRDIVIRDYGNYCSIELFTKEEALFDKEDLEKVKLTNWHLNDGYACNGKGKPMHKVILGYYIGVVHHKNRNKLDNRKSNLEQMSRAQHAMEHDNLKIRKDK